MPIADRNAGAEWRRYYMLPIAAALGYATSVTIGLTIATLVQAVFSIPIGLLVDRLGPRLFGLLLTTGAFALLGTASGSKCRCLAGRPGPNDNGGRHLCRPPHRATCPRRTVLPCIRCHDGLIFAFASFSPHLFLLPSTSFLASLTTAR